MSMTMTHTGALESAQRARLLAEHALRRSELERDQAARALELNLPPMPLGEAGRARLRAVYADAAASVERNRAVFDRAVEIERAAQVISAAIADEIDLDPDITDNLIQLFASRQGKRRDAAPRARVALSSGSGAARPARKQDSQ